MSVTVIDLLAALHMSYTVRPATEAATRASISTPVFPSVFANAVMFTELVFSLSD